MKTTDTEEKKLSLSKGKDFKALKIQFELDRERKRRN